MKKIGLLLLILLLCVIYSHARAEDNYGDVVLAPEAKIYEYDDHKFWPTMINKGMDFINDVKEYNEQLDGNNINRDFSEDLQHKYPEYSDKALSYWQYYVRKSVKAVRLVENIKNKVKQWLLDYELPIVVDDDQYEMGGPEEYVESDTPVIVHKFKKVIAYSKSPKDILAVEEKIAKDNNTLRPSQMMKWYRENIAQGNWKKIWLSLWDDSQITKDKNKQAQLGNNVYEMILKYDGIDKSGKFEGIINILPPEGKIVLLNNYKQYEGWKLDFDESKNIRDISVYFTPPISLDKPESAPILFYGKATPIYFAGTVDDPQCEAIIKLASTVNFCENNQCELQRHHVELKLKPVAERKMSSYAYYIDRVRNNIPREMNKKHFNIHGLFEDIKNNGDRGLRLDLKNYKDNYKIKIFPVGENAQYLAAPNISLRDNKLGAWFKILDDQFDYKNKLFKFWLIDNYGHQYLASLSPENDFLAQNLTGNISWYILGLAILGGFLLNFMPCVFPVLSLKILAFTQYGGLNKKIIRRNFIYNCCGIITAFLILATGLCLFKSAGVTLGWGIQFQSAIFLAVMIWVITYFLAYIMGITSIKFPNLPQKIMSVADNRKKMFEFVSGMSLVLLSTPCMAPYLGTALGIALAGNVKEIFLTVTATGFGLALPYIIIAIFPQIAFYIPRPGKWLKLINGLMILMLIITMLWLVFLLNNLAGNSIWWHWVVYIIIALCIWIYYGAIHKEIDKLDATENKKYWHKMFNRRNFILTILLIVMSLIDAQWHANRYVPIEDNYIIETADIDTIKNYVKSGRKVLLKIGADWCLTCQYNDKFILEQNYIEDEMENNNVIVIELDWTRYNKQILQLMQTFGRQGLPFYVLFSPKFKDGIVLPEILDSYELKNLLSM